jgi:hypothetical protein
MKNVRGAAEMRLNLSGLSRRVVAKRSGERIVKGRDRQIMLTRQSNEVVVSHLIGTSYCIGPNNAILAAKVVGNELMAWVGNELAQDGERLVWRHTVTEHGMRRDARKSQLSDGTC